MTDRELLRHTVATLAYRAAKALRDAPASFEVFSPGPTSRTPLEIVAHMGDLLDWATSMARGAARWSSATPQAWDTECARFFSSLKTFDDLLASDEALRYEVPRLFQGPIADALTHTGQLTLLRRLHGAPMKSESYNRADIALGRVGPDQTRAEPKYEFD